MSLFFFTDIEGSTKLWEADPAGMSAALKLHDELLDNAIEENGGRVFKRVGDGHYAVFHDVRSAVQAAIAIQASLKSQVWPVSHPIRVRCAFHRGDAEERGGDYFGSTLNRTARLLAIGHGEQILMTAAVAEEIKDDPAFGGILRDLGKHRLKDLQSAEEVWTIVHPNLRTEFPPLKSLDGFPNNLPRQLTSFIGRKEILLQADSALASNSLVTLVGSGGAGKTRLAVQIAANNLDQFEEGAWIVEFAQVTEPSQVTQAVASTLGLRDMGGRAIEEVVVDFLATKKLLLVVDNCEHVLDAAAACVARILRGSPGVKVVATSQEPLGVQGEAQLRVPSLDIGSASVPLTFAETQSLESVALFVDRARLVDSTFQLDERSAPIAAQICRRLDGIPLALELAASRVRALSLDQIMERLDDRFRLLSGGSRTAIPRHQTLRAAISWSYELLEEPEKTLLQRLALFFGGWTLDAAETVCEDEDFPSWEVLDGLVKLVDKSLVTTLEVGTGKRYRLLESVRQFVLERVEFDSAMKIQRRHAAFFRDFVVDAEDKLQGQEQDRYLDMLEREHDNIRAALAFSRDHPESIETGLEIVAAIGRFWTVRGFLTEGREWVDSLVSKAGPAPTALKGAALRTGGQLAYWSGDNESGMKFAQESLAICVALDDQPGRAKSLFRLGFVCLSSDEFGEAADYFGQGLELATRIGEDMGIPHFQNGLGEAATLLGDVEGAQKWFASALEGFNALGDLRSLAGVYKNLAILAIDSGRVEDATKFVAKSLEIGTKLRNLTGAAEILEVGALIHAGVDDFEKSHLLVTIASSIHESKRSRPQPLEAKRIAALDSSLRQILEEDRRNEIEKLGRASNSEDGLELVRAIIVETGSGAEKRDAGSIGPKNTDA